jgi:hypothetical protein
MTVFVMFTASSRATTAERSKIRVMFSFFA